MEKLLIKKQKHLFRRNAGKQIQYLAMTLPGLIFTIIFTCVPMVGVLMAFQDYVPAKGLFGSKWVGFKHFERLLNNRDVWLVTRNTVVIALGKIFAFTFVEISFAILLNEIRIKRLKKTLQTAVYLPNFISWVILADILIGFFGMDGSFNDFISALGFERINFLGSNTLFQPFLIWTDVWKGFGYGSIIYLAAITAIDPGLHEAAAIDGATWWRRVWHVTLPGMLPIIMLCFARSLTGILSAGFDQVFNLYNLAVYETGDILDTYVYRAGMVNSQYSFATAVGLLRSVIGGGLLLGVNEFSKKYLNYRLF